MGLRDLFETLKFPFYSKQEVEITTTPDTSQTAKPQNIESPYVSYDPFSSYTSGQLNQQQLMSTNKNTMIMKWRESSYLPEVDIAINEIANEAIVFDETEDAITLNLSDVELPDTIKSNIQDSFDKILYMLDFNERGDELFKRWYVDGQLNIESVYNNANTREGIKKLILLSPFNFQSYIDPKTQQKKYYYGEQSSTQFKQLNKDFFYDEQITSIDSGIWSIDRGFPLSYLNKAMKTINQLSLIEDTLVIYRLTKSTEKRVFYIGTGNLPKSKAEEYMKSLINKYRQKKIYNSELGIVENKNRSISILEDFWFPVNAKGEGTKVENIPGVQQNFGTFEDVDYFVGKVYTALNVPQSRRVKDSRVVVGNNIDIEKDELKFFKFVLKLRRRFNNLFVDLLKKDLLARKVMSIEDWNLIQEKIKFIYANSNQYTEIKDYQILTMRMEAANTANTLVDAGFLSKEYVQENILKLTEEEIKKIKLQNSETDDVPTDDLEDMSHSFGNDYSVRRREPMMPTSSSKTEQPKPDEPKPINPEEGAKENKLTSNDNMLLENDFLNQLQDGDIITDGVVKFLYKEGKFISIEDINE